jgi:cell division protein FtsI/penicillin-binding protein 2
MIGRRSYPKDWRGFQRRLKEKAWRKRFTSRTALLLAYTLLISASYGGSRILANREMEAGEAARMVEWENTGHERLTKQDLQAFISPLNLDLNPSEEPQFLVVNNEEKLRVEVSLDTTLQTYILKLLRRSRTSQTAVIVLKPTNGQILAMASYDRCGKAENLCLKSDFPAASIFKIISAAAAIESRGFSPEQTVAFKGKKHTLYKSQLKKGEGRYRTETSFKRAFSESINPVFGKIGIYDLGYESLCEYSNKFLFNKEIPFDLPIAVSSIRIPRDEFGLAEITSGFNKRTLVSPLHVALITSAIVNCGIIVEPWLVRRIQDESGETLYRARYNKLSRAVEEETAEQLKILMKETVLNGTCRKAFLPLRRKKSFQDIEIGAKTGTINDSQDLFKYDWVTVYALPKEIERGICVTVLAIHGEILGLRASEMARYIIQRYYNAL